MLRALFRRWLPGKGKKAGRSLPVRPWARPGVRPPVDPARGIHLLGDEASATGLGVAFRGLAAALRHGGWPLAFTAHVETPDRRTGDVLQPDVAPEQCEIGLIHLNGYAPFRQLVRRHRDLLARHQRVIAYWYWELPRLPEEWLDKVPLVDEVWVASRYVQDHLAAVLPVPVVRIPPAVVVPPVTPDRRAFDLPEDRFIFLFMFEPSSSVERKNPFAVVEAFRRAFANVPRPPLLLMKTHHLGCIPGRAALERDLGGALADVGGRLLDASWEREQVLRLVASCDAFVSLHRAEGFGLGLAEAMALGKPVVATAYSGNLDFMNPDNSYPVGCRLTAVRGADERYIPGMTGIYEPGQVWAEPDVDHAARLMRQLWDDPEDGRQRGERARGWIHDLYSPDAVARLVRERFGAEGRVRIPTAQR